MKTPTCVNHNGNYYEYLKTEVYILNKTVIESIDFNRVLVLFRKTFTILINTKIKLAPYVQRYANILYCSNSDYSRIILFTRAKNN